MNIHSLLRIDADNIDGIAEHPIFGAIPITLTRDDPETEELFALAEKKLS